VHIDALAKYAYNTIISHALQPPSCKGNKGGIEMYQDEKVLAVGIGEAARRLGLSARTVASLVLRRELPSRKVGRRRIIPVVELEAFVRGKQVSESLESEGDPEGSRVIPD
jgi:excisionase family DNA binding protein